MATQSRAANASDGGRAGAGARTADARAPTEAVAKWSQRAEDRARQQQLEKQAAKQKKRQGNNNYNNNKNNNNINYFKVDRGDDGRGFHDFGDTVLDTIAGEEDAR